MDNSHGGGNMPSKRKRRQSQQQREREEKLRRIERRGGTDFPDDTDTDEDFYTQEELEEVYDLLSNYSELDDLDGLLDMNDEDFYSKEGF